MVARAGAFAPERAGVELTAGAVHQSHLARMVATCAANERNDGKRGNVGGLEANVARSRALHNESNLDDRLQHVNDLGATITIADHPAKANPARHRNAASQSTKGRQFTRRDIAEVPE
jgi:hypothetical protein